MMYFAGEVAEFTTGSKLRKFTQSLGSNIKPFRKNLKRGFVRTRSTPNDYKMVRNLTQVRKPKSNLKFQRTQLNPSDAILEKNMTNVKYHRRNFNLFMGEVAEFKKKNPFTYDNGKERNDFNNAVYGNNIKGLAIGGTLGGGLYGATLYNRAKEVNKRRIANGMKPHNLGDYIKLHIDKPENLKYALNKYVLPAGVAGATIAGLAGYGSYVMKRNRKNKRKSNFSTGIDVAEFARKFKKKKEFKLRPPRQVNNWDKAREIRSGIGTAQRVSQDIRGWLSYARALRG